MLTYAEVASAMATSCLQVLRRVGREEQAAHASSRACASLRDVYVCTDSVAARLLADLDEKSRMLMQHVLRLLAQEEGEEGTESESYLRLSLSSLIPELPACFHAEAATVAYLALTESDERVVCMRTRMRLLLEILTEQAGGNNKLSAEVVCVPIQFTCFTGTKVQRLTQKALLGGGPHIRGRARQRCAAPAAVARRL
jgi:hypothetical protein